MTTKDTLIGDSTRQKPEAVPILMSFGMDCVGYPSSQTESTEKTAMVHGFDCQKISEGLNK